VVEILKMSILLVGAMLTLTKLANVLSTVRGIRRGGPGLEQNVPARRLMERWGVAPASWGVFVAAALMIGVSVWLAWNSGQLWGWAFVIAGIFISWVQAGVAKANWSGSPNRASRFAWKISAFQKHRS
jgi:hypothetical protein